MKKAKIKYLSLFLWGGMFVFSFFLPNKTFAITANTLGVMPQPNDSYPNRNDWFVYKVDAGTVIKDEIKLINNANRAAFIKLDQLDGSLTESGAFTLVDKPEDNIDVGAWIELSQTDFELEADSSRVVSFKIKVPENAEIGEHFGGLAIYEISSNPQVSASIRVGARIYLTVAGDVTRDFDVLGKTFSDQDDRFTFEFLVKNEGNIRNNLVVTEGKIYNIFGLFDEQAGINVGEILPNETATKTFVWSGKNKPSLGPYLARLTIEDQFKQVGLNNIVIPEIEPTTIWLFAFFMPYPQVSTVLASLFLVILLVILIWQFMIWRRAVKTAHGSVKEYRAKKDDRLTMIAYWNSIPWKTLARLNNLKSPDSLDDASKLYIPDNDGTRLSIKATYLWLSFLTKLFFQIDRRFQKKLAEVAVESSRKRKDVKKFTGLSRTATTESGSLKPFLSLKLGQGFWKVPARGARGITAQWRDIRYAKIWPVLFVLIFTLSQFFVNWRQVAYAAQFAYPDSDNTIGDGNWEDTTGGNGNTVLYEELSDQSDGTYIHGTSSATTVEFGLSDVIDPGVDTGHVARFRARATGGKGGEAVDFVLLQGSTTIATLNNQTITRSGSFSTYTLTLTEGQAATITNDGTYYTDLRLQLTDIGGITGSDFVDIADMELEVPDAPVPPSVVAPADVNLNSGTLGGTSDTTWAGGAGETVSVITGSDGAWTVSVDITTTFTRDGGSETIPDSEVFIVVDGLVGSGSDTLWSNITAGITETTSGRYSLNQNRVIASRTGGSNGEQSDMRPTFEIDVPGDTVIGDYLGTVQFTVV